MRNERKNLRFVPQKLRKSFANGNPRLSIKYHENVQHIYTYQTPENFERNFTNFVCSFSRISINKNFDGNPNKSEPSDLCYIP